MITKRTSGILLHISSLPGEFGIGDMGKAAYEWIDFLYETGTKYWQVLPLNPIGSGNSPYQALSAFAGNPLFIDLDDIINLNLLSETELNNLPKFLIQKVNFKRVTDWKLKLIGKAFDGFIKQENSQLAYEFDEFKLDNSFWLKEYSVFMALQNFYSTPHWNEWPRKLKMHDHLAITDFANKNKLLIEKFSFFQFLYFRQWKKLKKYANDKGVLLIGDIPIFTGFDCADVWAFPHLFQLDKNRLPTSIAGVPPDFFSDSGQLWGNPLYDWNEHHKDGFSWWMHRIQTTLQTVDLIRLDHFRGFAGYYKIPANAQSAKSGEWVSGPGKNFFESIEELLGSLPFIAEDLGVITPDVIDLREEFQLPGMKLMQFGFGKNADNEYLPHNYPVNCVAYTGTHDSDTSLSWFKNATKHERAFCSSYLGNNSNPISHKMIQAVWQSNAILSIAPMQDFLSLGGEARMNLPATPTGNWVWRMKPNAISPKLIEWIKGINITYDRASDIHNWNALEYFS